MFLDVHGIIRAKNEAAVGVILGAVDGNSLSIEQIGSASQLASLGVSSSDNIDNISVVVALALIHASQVILLGVLQRHRNKNHRALSKISRRDVLFSNLVRSAVGRDFAAALDPNVSSSLSLGSMRELVGANEGINLSKEGVNGGDDPAVFGLEDLRQIALTAEAVVVPRAGILLASLRGAVLQK